LSVAGRLILMAHVLMAFLSRAPVQAPQKATFVKLNKMEGHRSFM
jgi:hypothetical protein